MQPEIRFNGFSDDWVEKKLGDVSNLIQGAAWKSSEYLETGPNLLITISNLKSAIVDTSFGNRLAEVSLDLQKKYGIDNNDVLVSMTGNVGRVSIYKDCIGAPKALLNQRVGKVIPVNIDNLFLYAILRNELFERKMIDKGQGAAQLNISSKDIQQFPIQFPTLPEQQKIGSLFSKYDAIIALREQKLEELNALKKGLLQQMFPKNGAKVPELRFVGFTDDWEEKKLGEIGSFKSGVGFPVSEQGGTVGHPFYKVSDMNAKGNDVELISANNYVSDDQIRLKNWNPINTLPVIVFAKVGAALLLNRKRIVKHPFLIDNNLMAYSFDKSWDMYFGKMWFDTVNLPKYAQTGALPSFNASDIKRIHVLRPTLPEQQKIGQLFKYLDARISNEQIKIEQLKAQKQGLLQRML